MEVSEEPLKEASEEVAADEEEKELSAEPEKKKARQAAQNAMEKLKTVAKLCEESDEMDNSYSDYNDASEEKEQETVEENPDALKQVIEIPDEDKSNRRGKVQQLSEDKLVVVCKSMAYVYTHVKISLLVKMFSQQVCQSKSVNKLGHRCCFIKLLRLASCCQPGSNLVKCK